MGISHGWMIRLLCVAKTHWGTTGVVNGASPTRCGRTELAFPLCLLCVGSCAHCRTQTWARGGSKLKPGLPQIGIRPGVSGDVSHGSAPQNCKKMQHCSWTACGSSCWIREKWWEAAILLFHSPWIPAVLSRCFPGGLNSIKQPGQTMERILEVSSKPQHRVCF